MLYIVVVNSQCWKAAVQLMNTEHAGCLLLLSLYLGLHRFQLILGNDWNHCVFEVLPYHFFSLRFQDVCNRQYLHVLL